MTTSDSSEQLQAQAAELRIKAAQARTDRDTVLAQAQQEADRILAEARVHANTLWQEAAVADRQAEPLELRAGLLNHRDQVRAQVPAAQQHVVHLVQEADELAKQIEALQQRLGELGQERENVGVQLAAARESGDVDAVTERRTRMTAVDEVISALTSQRQVAEDRLVKIGDPDGIGELGKAATAVLGLQNQLRRLDNEIDPDSVQAQAERLLGDLAACIADQTQLMQEQQNQPARRANTIIR